MILIKDFGTMTLDNVKLINIELVWNALKECYDPEISVNIVDLGLIYHCAVLDNTVMITMTLTSPMCSMGPILIANIKEKVLAVENVADVEVEMVFDPPWTKDRMSDVAKIELGLI